MRSLIRDQAESTRVALEFVQVGANKAALDALCKEKDEEFQKALAEFDEGKISVLLGYNVPNSTHQHTRSSWRPRKLPRKPLL